MRFTKDICSEILVAHNLSGSGLRIMLPLLEIAFEDLTIQDLHDFLKATVDAGARPIDIRPLLAEGRNPRQIASHWKQLMMVSAGVRQHLFPAISAQQIEHATSTLAAIGEEK